MASGAEDASDGGSASSLFKFPNHNDDQDDLFNTHYPFAAEAQSYLNPEQTPPLNIDAHSESSTRISETQSSRPTAKARIPNEASIIDVDAIDDSVMQHVPSARHIPMTYVKAEGADLVMLGDNSAPTIKEEVNDVEFLWADVRNDVIELSDSEDEHDIRRLLQIPVAGSANEGPQPKAVSEPSEEAPISDIMHSPKRLSTPLNANSVSNNLPLPWGAGLHSSEQASLLNTTPNPVLGQFGLTARDFKAKRAPMDRTKILQLQKPFVERSLGRSIATDAGGIFQGLRGISGSPSAATDQQVPQNLQDENPSIVSRANEHAWMEESFVDDGEGAAAAFLQIKKSCRIKRRSRQSNLEDDVMFMKGESAEKARLRRLAEDHNNSDGYDSDDVEARESDNDLFVPEGTPESSHPKRPYVATVQTDDEAIEGPNVKEGTVQPSKRAKLDKKTRVKALEKELEHNMMSGIEDLLARDKKKATRKAGSKEQKSRKGDGRKTQSNADASKTKTPKSKKSDTQASKSKPTQVGYMMNVGSLWSSDVYADANANLSVAALPVVTATRKDEALKSLLANVPLEDIRTARGEKEHLRKATITLGPNKVKADGNGGWKLKGMKSSLLNHQLQGAAWMKDRENGDVQPLGGLLADEMGFGKTVMMIAAMTANRPSPDESRSTLIVCSLAIINQWETELEKHAEPGVFEHVIRHHASSRIRGTGDVSYMAKADVVLTTYSEVIRSYPVCKPPMEIILPEKKKDWWMTQWEVSRGLLHRVQFHRIVLDEAQAIKNHVSQTSIACRALMAKHRWAISGTPIQNRVEELFPYFKFLRVKHTGSFDIFRHNFCVKDDDNLSNERLHTFLKQIMIRRTHVDRLFGAPLIKMPKNTSNTIYLEFNNVERAIYNIVLNRFVKAINAASREGTLEKKSSGVFTMLLRLRQLTAHLFLIQDVMQSIFQIEDIERLWKATIPEVTPEDDPAQNMATVLREMIAAKGQPDETEQTANVSITPQDVDSGGIQTKEPSKLIFKFRKFLRDLTTGSKWQELQSRSTCHKCQDLPDEPYVTSCFHVYCKECLKNMAYEASTIGQDSTSCIECGEIFSESHPCDGLLEAKAGESSRSSPNEQYPMPLPRKKQEDNLRWINAGSAILPSTKTAAVQVQIEEWLADDPTKKIIVFSQFHMLMRILEKVCQQKQWTYCTYHGRLSHQARDKEIGKFGDDADTKIMIASLKCGGVGLNLTMASRVICVDLWWNSSVEQQAFCRVFRIGQESETFITRFVIRDTVDEKLEKMQETKKEIIGAAIDDNRMLDKLSLPNLMRLFGEVNTDENSRPFILVDDDGEFDAIVPPMPDTEDFSDVWRTGAG